MLNCPCNTSRVGHLTRYHRCNSFVFVTALDGMNTLSHSTRNNIPEKSRGISVGLLNQTLANLIDLHSQTLEAHWTVRGMHFYQLHKLFDFLAEKAEKHIDDVAERIMAIGGIAQGTVRLAAKNSKVPEYPITGMKSEEHIAALSERYGLCANAVREAIDAADTEGDRDTADLLTAVSRTLDQALWFLEANEK